MSSSNGGGGGGDLSQTQQQASQPTQQQQQQWVQPQWMQYPAAAMAMMQQQQMMMYAHPQYLPYHYQQQLPHHQQHHLLQQHQQSFHPHHKNQQQQQQDGSNGGEEAKTVWVGDLHHWMDETYLHTCFNQTGEVYSVKVIRNKQTGQSEGYGFVEFSSHATAEKVLQSYSSSVMPNTDQPFRLNWAVFSSGNRQSENGSDLSIFVGDLAADVTDTLLQETFSSKYPSVKGAKVVIDSNTGRSKGYGFVRFGDENERSKAMTEMNGVFCLSRPMRIGVATPKKASGGGGGGGGYSNQQFSQAVVLAGGHPSNGAASQGSQGYSDSNNTTIFVGGLDSDISDEDLRQPFSQFGEVVSVKIPVGKGCGFVQFANRKGAEDAMQELNGTVIGKQSVRLSWGRTPANKQWRNDNGNQWNGGSYYGGGAQGYGGYSNGNSAAVVANGDS